MTVDFGPPSSVSCDGLVTNVSLILGFAGANPGHDIVRLAGLAGLVAGAFSMGSGEYLSMRSQKELYEYEIDVERTALATSPEEERLELRDLFVSRGIEDELAERLSTDLMRNPDLALRTHAREELGIDPSATGSPWIAASSSFLFFSVGALHSASPVDHHCRPATSCGGRSAWPVRPRLLVGGAVGHFTRRGVSYSALRALIIMAVASAVTFGVGALVGSLRAIKAHEAILAF